MRKSFGRNWHFLGIFFIFLFCVFGESLAQENEWPREIQVPKATIVIYQPQPETFKDNHLTGRSAVSVTMKDNPEPVFGAAWYDASIATDRDNRTVEVQEVKVTKVKFPEATPEQEQKFIDVVSREMTGWKLKMSLDRLLTTLELADKEQKISSQLSTQVPKILYSDQPAVLVVIDGKPILRPVEGSQIQQVINTAFQIFMDPAAKLYYLKGSPQWFSASDPLGEWKVANAVPEAVQKLGSSVDNAPTTQGPSGVPKIIVATEPTELIVSQGPPQWAPIADTGLSDLQNSENAVFFQPGTGTYFAMFSGRWFASKGAPQTASYSLPKLLFAGVMGPWGCSKRAAEEGPQPAAQQAPPPVSQEAPQKPVSANPLNGPWAYLSADQLPEGFRKFPSDFKKSWVLASIPGTDEADDAVMDAQIPQTAVIDKKKASFTPTYDGPPQFEKVSGTAMDYAVNTPNQILKDGDKYYAVDQGVWYVADSPEGPWRVSDSRPKDVDQIPPDNPNYNTKYVYVYDSDEDNAYVGYTAGYLGSFILGTTLGAALSWGTGYYYRPWYGSYYYPRPWSYGYHAYYNPYTGGWGYRGPNGGAWYRPNEYWRGNGYWGAGGYRDIDIDNLNVNNVNIDRDRINNNIYNRKQNFERNVDRNRLGQIEQKRLDKLGERGPMAGRDPSKPAGNRPNDIFADKDGNVFRKDKDGQWQRNEGRDWHNVDKPAGLGDKLAAREPAGLGDKKIEGLKDGEPGALKDRKPEGLPDKKVPGDRKGDLAAKQDREPRERPAAQRPAPKRDVSFDRSGMERQNVARERGNQRARNYQNYQASRGSSGIQRGGGFDRGGGGGGGGQRGGGGGRRGGGGGGRRR